MPETTSVISAETGSCIKNRKCSYSSLLDKRVARWPIFFGILCSFRSFLKLEAAKEVLA